MELTKNVGKNLIATSHRRQLAGEDYQAVAQDLCDGIKGATQEDYDALSNSPDIDCECGFCKTVDWQID